MGDCADPRRPRQPATARGRAIRGRVPRPRVGPAFGGRTAAAVREVTPTPRARPATTNRAGSYAHGGAVMATRNPPSNPSAVPTSDPSGRRRLARRARLLALSAALAA